VPVPNEQMLISSILKHHNLPAALKKGLNQTMFYLYPEQYKWIEHYYLNHSKTPSMEAFVTKFNDFTVKRVEQDETEHFTEEVKEDHKRKSALRAIEDVMKKIENGDNDAAVQLMHDRSIKIHHDLGIINDGDVFKDNDDILKEFRLRKARFEKYGASGIPTGFSTYDSRTGGLAPGEFVIFAARSGVGKSWTLQKMAATAALQGYTVQYNALEQPRTNVMARIMSLVSKDLINDVIDPQSVLWGHGYDDMQFDKLLNKFKSDVGGKLHVADGTKGRVTTSMMAAQIERNKPDVVFVDHITLVGRENKDFAGVSEVADDLTQLSNQYGIPIVSASQLNRAGVGNAGLENLSESDKIGQNASAVVIIKKLSQRAIEYSMVKNRNGIGDFKFHAKFEPNLGIFKEVPFSDIKEIVFEDEAEESLSE
jgi:replicative DNA helicase